MLSDIINHIANRPYMSGIERDQNRIKANAEIFTPNKTVMLMINKESNEFWEDTTKTIIDPTCGDGQFLGHALIRKLEAIKKKTNAEPTEEDFKIALGTIYGVDIMTDNVLETRNRLLCGREHLRPIVVNNIREADALIYDFEFDGAWEKEQDRIKAETAEVNSLFSTVTWQPSE